MHLTKEEQIEITLMAMSATSRNIAAEFNRKHVTNLTYDTVSTLIFNFEKLGLLQMKDVVESIQ